MSKTPSAWHNDVKLSFVETVARPFSSVNRRLARCDCDYVVLSFYVILCHVCDMFFYRHFFNVVHCSTVYSPLEVKNQLTADLFLVLFLFLKDMSLLIL